MHILTPSSVGLVLALNDSRGNSVIRSTALLVVLVLTGTPTALAACVAWCDATALSGTEATRCHYTTTDGTPRVSATAQNCEELLQAVLFVRAYPQRAGTDPASDHAVALPHPTIHNAVCADASLAGSPGALFPRGYAYSTVLRI